jgi:phenylalanyl-tRNA synthetase beta chain
VFEVKAAIEALLESLKIKSFQFQTPAIKDMPIFLHQGQCAVLMVEGKKVGFLGSLHPGLRDENKIRVPVVLVELDLGALYKGQPRLDRFESVSKFPKVERDLALLMDKAIKASDVTREIKKLAGVLMVDCQIFDLYEGDKLEKGQKSVAFRLSFQDKNATLHDELVNKSIEGILTGLKQKFSIIVR